MLISELVDRTLNEWLYPSGENLPAFDILAANITDSATSLTVEGLQSFIPPNTILEIGSEQLLVEDVVGTAVTVNERGWRETTAAAHLAGAKVWIEPTFTRKSIFNALSSAIGELYAMGLYARGYDDTQAFTSSTLLSLPAGGKDILSIVAEQTANDPIRLRPGRDYTEYSEYTPTKFKLRTGGLSGSGIVVVYTKDFVLPTAEDDDVTTDCLVPSSLAPYLPMAAAGHLLQGKALPDVFIEDVRSKLASEGVQPGTPLNIGQVLLQTFERTYVGREVARQIKQDRPAVRYVSA